MAGVPLAWRGVSPWRGGGPRPGSPTPGTPHQGSQAARPAGPRAVIVAERRTRARTERGRPPRAPPRAPPRRLEVVGWRHGTAPAPGTVSDETVPEGQ